MSTMQEIGHQRGSLTLSPKTMFFGHVMRADGLEKEMTINGEKKLEERTPKEEVSTANSVIIGSISQILIFLCDVSLSVLHTPESGRALLNV